MQENLDNALSLEEELNHEAEVALENENIEEQLAEEEINPSIKLDYTLQSPTERNELVKKIIEQTPPEKLTNRYLEILTDYIISAKIKNNISFHILFISFLPLNCILLIINAKNKIVITFPISDG